MAIRSRRTFAPSPSSGEPTFLPENAWRGMWLWFVSALCGAEVFSLLAAFAWRGVNGRLPDVTTVLIAVPAGVILAVLVIATLWNLLARVSLTAGLAFLARILPLTWLVPAADLIRTGGQGIVAMTVPLDAGAYFMASFTGALLPSPSLIPVGIRLGIFSAALATAFVVWFTRKDIIRSVIAALVTSIVLVKISFLPSAIGIWEFVLRTGRLVSGTVETQRETLLAVTNGYWWTNLYDRFPSAVDAQADLAIRLTSAGILVLALGVVLLALFVWLLPARFRSLKHFFRAWSAFDFVLYAGGAAVLTKIVTTVPVSSGTWAYAALLLLVMLSALRIHAVLERCLHHARMDGDALAPGDPSEGPVACGDLPPHIASGISRIAFGYVLVAAWLLGWPVFASVLAFLASSHLSRDHLWASWPHVATFFRSMGSAALALVGFFFMAQHARLSGMAALVMLLAAAHRAGMEMFWKTKRNP